MYILLENDQKAHLGPIEWNPRMFQNVLKDDLNIITSLPTTKTDNDIITINDTLKIYPAQYVYPTTHNSKIEQYAGPFWSIVNGVAIGTFTNVPVSLEAAKNAVKGTVANNRWVSEVSGITLNIQGQDVFITTQRGERDIFLQALQQTDTNSTRLWKFNNVWLTLTYTDLQQIVTAVVTHIQDLFTWEQSKFVEIDAATSLSQLDGINLQLV